MYYNPQVMRWNYDSVIRPPSPKDRVPVAPEYDHGRMTPETLFVHVADEPERVRYNPLIYPKLLPFITKVMGHLYFQKLTDLARLLRAGSPTLQKLFPFKEKDGNMKALFCSQLVAAAYMEMRLVRLPELDDPSPESDLDMAPPKLLTLDQMDSALKESASVQPNFLLPRCKADKDKPQAPPPHEQCGGNFEDRMLNQRAILACPVFLGGLKGDWKQLIGSNDDWVCRTAEEIEAATAAIPDLLAQQTNSTIEYR